MPQRAATIESLPMAFEVVKAMQADDLEWGESEETFTLTLSNPTGAAGLSIAEGSVPSRRASARRSSSRASRRAMSLCPCCSPPSWQVEPRRPRRLGSVLIVQQRGDQHR